MGTDRTDLLVEAMREYTPFLVVVTVAHWFSERNAEPDFQLCSIRREKLRNLIAQEFYLLKDMFNGVQVSVAFCLTPGPDWCRPV